MLEGVLLFQTKADLLGLDSHPPPAQAQPSSQSHTHRQVSQSRAWARGGAQEMAGPLPAHPDWQQQAQPGLLIGSAGGRRTHWAWDMLSPVSEVRL